MKTHAVNLLVLLTSTLLAFALAKFVAGCGHAPPPPAHVESRVTVTGTDVDASTRWKLCATPRHCVFVDSGLLWSTEGRVVCVELPQFDLITCHDLED